ncbi:MAG: hypothetical protein WEF50_14650 [Myxococcota bacterium]
MIAKRVALALLCLALAWPSAAHAMQVSWELRSLLISSPPGS